MGLAAPRDCVVQFHRPILEPDGHGGLTAVFYQHGARIDSLREDVCNIESTHGGVFRPRLKACFAVRLTDFTSDLSTKDRLSCDGIDYEIVHINQAKTGQRRQLIEILAESLF